MIRTLLTTSALALVLNTAAIAQTTTTDPAAPAPETTQTDPMAPADPAAPADAMAPADPMAPADAMAPAVTPAPAVDGAMATSSEAWDWSAGYTIGNDDFIVNDLLGAPVYSSASDDAEEIGTVNDLIITADGDINAVIIGVGGFLGIGEKNVAVDYMSLEHTMAADNTWRWVLPTTAEALEAAPDFVWEDPNAVTPAADPMAPAMAPADPAMAPADPAMAPADPAMAPADPAMAPATDTVAPGAVMPREGYAPLERDALTAENLTGATVIGPEGDDIASVGDLLLDESGQIDAMLIDFGGFLGIGQKRVAVALDNLEFASNENGDLVIYSDFTREQLDAAPEYDEATYATDPAQRFTNM